ncbi:MAG: hypothetical protein HYZ44_10260 [Bacteroidetes bacterium]|nr:hypothetical protein [Bacteroidota bacterium]
MKKWNLILSYLGLWAMVIIENLSGGIISYEKSRIIVALYVGVLLVALPYILFKILTEFQVKENSKWYATILSTFILVIPYGIWTGKVDEKRLQESSRETIGVVYKDWISRRKHLVRVKYSVDHIEYTTFSETDRHKVLALGDTVTIIYWTKNPELCKIKELWK